MDFRYYGGIVSRFDDFLRENLTQVQPNFMVWLGSGALIGLGVIVPEMSPSNFLIYFGLYEKMSSDISHLNMATVIPLVIGAILCVLVLAKLANYLFRCYYAGMYHFILGTVLGSSLTIFPTVVAPAFTPEGLVVSGISFLDYCLCDVLCRLLLFSLV